jgi:preprotein translocase subunit SecA
MSTFAPEWTVKALSWIGWEEGQPIYHGRISKGIERAQKKVEERNFEIRKSLLEYDEVMDYQRKIFYSRRRDVLAGKGLKQTIWDMINSSIDKHCDAVLSKDYAVNCIIEWTRTAFDVELKSADVEGAEVEQIEELVKGRAKDNVKNTISLSMGEYLEDLSDPETWDVAGLSKWAMSSFQVNLSSGKVKQQSPEVIEQQLIAAAQEQLDRRDCSQLREFLKDDFALSRLTEWARAKFDVRLDVERLKTIGAAQTRQVLTQEVAAKYRQREIEYPVEFAMSMAYGPQGPNVYAFEALASWANRKYNAGLTAEQIQNTKPKDLYKQLLELSGAYTDGKLEQEIEECLGSLDSRGLVSWANERFGASFTEQQLSDGHQERKKLILGAAREFLRSELSDLERYVLLHVYDGTWKDHLYAMDHLRDSIWTRSFAEKDPKTEYKREGFRMFNQMLESIEERVTDIIFRVRLEAGATARSVWNVSRVAHDEVAQFGMAERQRAAAQAPQAGEQVVRQIKLDKPKVGRNDPCPCGSGKKYKKCHGKNA